MGFAHPLRSGKRISDLQSETQNFIPRQSLVTCVLHEVPLGNELHDIKVGPRRIFIANIEHPYNMFVAVEFAHRLGPAIEARFGLGLAGSLASKDLDCHLRLGRALQIYRPVHNRKFAFSDVLQQAIAMADDLSTGY